MVVRGSGTMSVAGDTQSVSEGDLILVPPATEHSVRNDGERGFRLLLDPVTPGGGGRAVQRSARRGRGLRRRGRLLGLVAGSPDASVANIFAPRTTRAHLLAQIGGHAGTEQDPGRRLRRDRRRLAVRRRAGDTGQGGGGSGVRTGYSSDYESGWRRRRSRRRRRRIRSFSVEGGRRRGGRRHRRGAEARRLPAAGGKPGRRCGEAGGRRDRQGGARFHEPRRPARRRPAGRRARTSSRRRGLRAPGGAGGEEDGPISLGTATAAELDTIDGIGPVTAEDIIKFREEHGGLSSVDQLDQISGIGPATMEALRARLQP